MPCLEEALKVKDKLIVDFGLSRVGTACFAANMPSAAEVQQGREQQSSTERWVLLELPLEPLLTSPSLGLLLRPLLMD